jgi:tryptophan-rich sensory protein
MGILLAFAPFIVFAVLERIVGPGEALAAGAAVSAALILRDLVRPGRGVKILEAGTFALFAGLALYTLLSGAAWSVIGVRLCVDVGLLLIVAGSIAIGRPFTLQYAREQVAAEDQARPEFLRVNYVISSVWALAFLVMVLAELALLYAPGMPSRAGMLAIILALVGAVKFTGWYPNRKAGAG